MFGKKSKENLMDHFGEEAPQVDWTKVLDTVATESVTKLFTRKRRHLEFIKPPTHRPAQTASPKVQAAAATPQKLPANPNLTKNRQVLLSTADFTFAKTRRPAPAQPPTDTAVPAAPLSSVLKHSFSSSFSRLGRQLMRVVTKKRAITAGAAICAVVVLSGAWQFQNRQSAPNDTVAERPPLPAVLSRATTTKEIYAPAILPEGYTISSNESTTNETLSAYTLISDTNAITVTIQQNIPRDKFLGLFEGAETVATDFGNAYMDVDGLQAKLAGLQLANGTSVLFTAQAPVEKEVLSLILKTLEKR
jgi:hypothetical protein